MIDLDDLRKRPDVYKKAAQQKNIAVDIDAFLKMDTLRRELQKMTDDMRARKNSASKRIPSIKGKEKEEALKEMKELSTELKLREDELDQTEETWNKMQLDLPALPHTRVPVGKSEKDNKEVKKWGEVRKFNFETKDHVELGETLGILDIPRGVKIAGARSYYLKGDGARLHRAVLQCALDLLTKKGWTHFTPPYMASWECLMGTGFFPGAEELETEPAIPDSGD